MKTTRLLLLVLLAATAVFASPRRAAPDRAAAPAVVLPGDVIVLSALDRADGSGSDRPVTRARARQMLFELQRSGQLPPGAPGWEELAARARPLVRRGAVPVLLLDAACRWRVEGERAWRDGHVFAAAPLRERLYHGLRTEFVFDLAWRVGDREPAGRLAIDPGDGRGWRPVPADGRLVVSYPTRGRRLVRVRLEIPDGRTLESSFPVEVVRLETPAPHDTLHVIASVPYQGEYGTGDAYVYLSDRHASLANPVVVPEGFDLDNSMDWDELYDLLDQQDLVETLRARGYDAVVLNFSDATDYIQRNAMVLSELLDEVRALLPSDRTVAVIGPSMGGLVSRYALCWLEDQGVDHGVRTWISFDSPQRGANVPLGIQHWLEFFRDESADAAALLAALDSPAARQMLLYHHGSTSGLTAAPDPLLAELRNDLAALGDWPQQPRRVAIVNGSGTGADQGFVPGDQLVDYTYRSLVVDIDGNVWALPDGNTLRIFQGMIDRIWPLPDDYRDVTVAGTLPWDGAPGGWRASMAQMDTTSVPYGDVVALHPNHCFIPTVSALALDTDDPWYDVAGDPDLVAHTPFDVVYFPTGENQEHVSITAESAAWFLDEIEEGVTGAGQPVPAVAVHLQVSPNPFNPRTEIVWTLPSAASCRLAVFDLAGRRVRTLLAGTDLGPGRHAMSWHGDDDGGRALPAGIYLLRLQVGPDRETAAVTLVR